MTDPEPDHSIDIGPVEAGEPAQYREVPAEPETLALQAFDEYEVYAGDMGIAVPEWLLVLEHPEDEPVHSRGWLFVGREGLLVLYAYYRHRYGPGNPAPDDDADRQRCCFQLGLEHGLVAAHCPDEVRDAAARIGDAPVASLNDEAPNAAPE